MRTWNKWNIDDGMLNGSAILENSLKDSHSPHDPATALTVIHPGEMKTHIHTTCTQILIAALFIMVQTGNNPKVHKFVN